MRTREEYAYTMENLGRYDLVLRMESLAEMQLEATLDCRDLLIEIRVALTTHATPDPISSLNRMKDRYE